MNADAPKQKALDQRKLCSDDAFSGGDRGALRPAVQTAYMQNERHAKACLSYVSCEHYGSMNIWHVKPAFVKNFLRHMDYKIARVRIGFCNVDLILLTGLAEVDNIGQIFRLLCREFL